MSMYESANHHEPRLALWLVLITAMASVTLATFWLTPGHSWGDDFAGYLLQAKALVSATPRHELEVNAQLMAASDWRAGPDAYPWGYPAILALLMWIAGQSLAAFKMVSIGSIGIVTLGAGALACASGLGLFATACVAILVGMQPDLIRLGNFIGSDAVFLALTAGALVFAVLALRTAPGESSTLRRRAALIAAVLGSLSYFVRSNGAVTLLAIAGSFVAVPLVAQRRSIRSVAADMAPFAAICAGLIIAYFALLPDGTFVHVRYLTAAPASLARRSLETIDAFGSFFPIMLLSPPFDRMAVAAVAALALLGALRLRGTGLLLALYSAGHLLLLILFPYKGGQRYYLPVLLTITVLAVGGAELLVRRAVERVSRTRAIPVAGGALVALLFIGAVAANFYRLDLQQPQEAEGPYSPAALELFRYVRQQPADIQPVAFFKPRALRFLAGKDAVTVRTLDTARRVNSIVICREPTAAPLQLSEAQVAALKDFRETFRNEEFTLYVRKPVATAKIVPARRPPERKSPGRGSGA